MKNIILFLITVLSVMMFCNCSSNPDEGPFSYTMELSLPYTESEQIVILSDLKSAITDDILYVPSWLSVEILPYSSGSPEIKIIHAKNPELNTREWSLTIVSESGDMVQLLITQEALPEGTTIDDIHDGSTDQPGY